jgi:hypothetical protein
VTVSDPMDRLARIDNSSFCRLNGPSARLTLWWQPVYNSGSITEPNPRYISFNFSAVSLIFLPRELTFICTCTHTHRAKNRIIDTGHLMLFILTSFSLEWISLTIKTLPVCLLAHCMFGGHVDTFSERVPRKQVRTVRNILYIYNIIWYDRHAKYMPSMALWTYSSAKYSIAHSHAWVTGHSNLANCKFILV